MNEWKTELSPSSDLGSKAIWKSNDEVPMWMSGRNQSTVPRNLERREKKFERSVSLDWDVLRFWIGELRALGGGEVDLVIARTEVMT